MIRRTILAALAAALAMPAFAAQEDFHWTGKVAAGAAVEIKGVNGGIVATGAAGGDVEVTAVKKGRKSDPTEVKVEVVEHAGGVTICAVYPSTGAPNECKPGEGGRMSVRDNDVNVEFKVTVPAGVRFIGRTVNGGIAASAASRLARERETIATRAPSAANACTQASPIPLLAPVTTTTRSFSPSSIVASVSKPCLERPPRLDLLG